MIGTLQIRYPCAVFIHVTIPSASHLLPRLSSSLLASLGPLVYSLTPRLFPWLCDCTSITIRNRCRTSTFPCSSPYSRSIPLVLVSCTSDERRRCRFALPCFDVVRSTCIVFDGGFEDEFPTTRRSHPDVDHHHHQPKCTKHPPTSQAFDANRRRSRCHASVKTRSRNTRGPSPWDGAWSTWNTSMPTCEATKSRPGKKQPSACGLLWKTASS